MPRRKDNVYVEEPIEVEQEAKPEQKKEPEQPAQPKQYINIKDVQPYDSGDLTAWFVDAKGNKEAKAPTLRGTLMNSTRNEAIPTVLVLAMDGTFLPPFLIAGFIGMYPKDYVFPEVMVEEERKAETESEPEPKQKKESMVEFELEPKPEPTPELVKAKEKSGILSIFKKKPEKPKGISKETKDLVAQLNATKSTE